MMEQEYRREMDQLTLSGERQERIVEAMTKERSRSCRRRPWVRLTVAAAACVALTTSALALSPTLRERLEQRLGSFVPYSQSFEDHAAVDQDLEVRVVSAVTDQYRMKLYFQVTDLTGERLTDEHARLSCVVRRDWGDAGVVASGEGVGYDPETHTVLFEYTLSGYQPAEYTEELEMDVSAVVPGVYEFETAQPLSRALLSGQTLDCMTLGDGQVVLTPGQTPAALEGFDKAQLSSMGFAVDGTLQFIFQLADGAVLERSDILVTAQLPEEVPDSAPESIQFTWEGHSYVGLSYRNFPPEEAEDISLSQVYGTVATQEPIQGEWNLNIPVENLPSREISLQGSGDACLPDQLILSPLGAVLRGRYEAGYWGNQPFRLIMKDGCVVEVTKQDVGYMSKGGVCTLGNWEFDDPVEMEDVAAVQVGPWQITVLEDGAGEMRLLEQH